MGKHKSGQSSLGRALIKDRFKGRRVYSSDTSLHTAELDDGFDWGRLNLRSVTEESSLQAFLSTASMAGTEFAAEKLNVQFVNPDVGAGLPTKEERRRLQELHLERRSVLQIPRRPAWDETTTPEELEDKEKESFLNWRRGLVKIQEDDEVLMTPFEKNIELWRQLWRVIEKSDVVVQIVDARNPLMFRCEDLEKYVNEVGEEKMNLILINKADLLTDDQRKMWADYFCSIHLPTIFFSAIKKEEAKDTPEVDEEPEIAESDTESSDDDQQPSEEKEEVVAAPSPEPPTAIDVDSILATGNVLSRDELVQFFKTVFKGKTVKEGVTTIGLVGYPNVGKSSTINNIMTSKKVAVSATPGKTKHFQTLFVDSELLLCDCPGLVFPNFVATKADMFVSGILPIDEMRDHVPPVNLIASYFPRRYLEDHYSILLPPPMDGDDSGRCPTSEELLTSYGYMRGFMTQRGLPDQPRTARYILKDFVAGRLLYCHAPPGIDQDFYQTFPLTTPVSTKKMTPYQARMFDLPQVPEANFANKSDPDVENIEPDQLQSSINDLHLSQPHHLGMKGFKGKPGGPKAAKNVKKIKARKAYAHLDTK